MEIEQDLRSTSDEMLRTLEQLEVLETEKRAEPPGSVRFLGLAKEIERLAAVVFSQTARQQSLAEQTHAAARSGVEIPPIEKMTTAREVSVILSEWRDAERHLASTGVDTAEHAKAAGDVRRLREEYHRAYKAQSES